MTPQEWEDFAADSVCHYAEWAVTGKKAEEGDIKAATIAVLWRALEMASDGMSKETLRKMIFGDEQD